MAVFPTKDYRKHHVSNSLKNKFNSLNFDDRTLRLTIETVFGDEKFSRFTEPRQ